jgi:hypothetical protein
VLALGIGLLLRFQGTFLSFAGGSYHLPVIAGPPVLIYLSAMIVVASAAGEGLLRLQPRIAAAQLAWIVVATVLAAAALGRADFGHVFWNGLPVIMVAPIVIWQWRPRVAMVCVAVVAVVFIGSLARFTLQVQGAGLLRQMVAMNLVDQLKALDMAPALGVPADDVRSLQAAPLASLSETQTARLQELSNVAIPSGFDSRAAWKLAGRRALAPYYVDQPSWISWEDAQRSMSQLDRAKYLIVSLDTWYYATRSPAARIYPIQPVQISPPVVENDVINGNFYGLPPFAINARFPQLDTQSIYYSYLANNWQPVEPLGPWAILEKKALR